MKLKSKKLISLALVFAIGVCSVIFGTSVFGSAADYSDPTIEIGSAHAEAGETFEIPIVMYNNPGIVAVCVSVTFDSSLLTLESAANGSFMDDARAIFGKAPSSSPYKLSWEDGLSTTNNVNNGTMAVLTFSVDENAPSGVYEIGLSYVVGSTFDVDLTEVSFDTVSGSVTIGSPEPLSIVGIKNTVVIDEENKLIYGLEQGLTEERLFSEFIGVSDSGRGHIEISGAVGTGAEVTLIDDTTNDEAAAYNIVIFGDITGNGIADGEDLIKMKPIVAQTAFLPEGVVFKTAGDLTGDGKVESDDLLQMKAVAAQIRGIDQTTGLTFDITT